MQPPTEKLSKSPNEETLLTYEQGFETYIAKTPEKVTGEFKHWLDFALSELPLNARILEIGSGSGRDANYMRSLGYAPNCTDAVEGFVNHLRKQGFKAHLLNALTDNLPQTYDLILANAVLLHFTRPETQEVLRKISSALTGKGRFAFTVKEGREEKWSEEKLGGKRYFCFWTTDEITPLLKAAGFSKWNLMENIQDANQTRWVHVIAYKDIPTS